MKKRKNLMIVVLLSLGLIFTGCGKTAEKEDRGNFEIYCVSAGKADAFVLMTENHAVVVDTGEKSDGGKVINALREKGFSKVDYLILSHYDKDHVGGAKEVLSSLTVNEILETPIPKAEDPDYGEFVNTVKSSGVTATDVASETVFTLDSVKFTVYPPQSDSYEENESNNSSLIVTAEHGENKFLFMGDAQKQRIKEWIKGKKGSFDFIKVPYHGEYMNTEEELFAQVKPEYAVITCSEKNPAEAETVDALTKAGATVYETANGDISVKSDGYRISAEQKEKI